MAQTAEIIQLNERRPIVKADTDEGWFKVATTLARSECSVDMSAQEWKLYNVVKLKTYGYRKSFDWISASQIEEETSKRADGTKCKGIKANKVSEIKKRLVERNILKLNGREIGVNTVVSEWLEKPITPKKAAKKLPLSENTFTPISEKITPIQGKNYPRTGVHNKKDNNNKIITKDIVGQPDVSADYAEVISYLNEKAGKGFKNLPANQKFIKARLGDGHTISDLKAVIDHKTAEWKDDRKMVAYLRPSTLFNASNFEGYLSIVNLDPIVLHNQNSNQIDWDDTTWANDLNSDEGVNLI
jgi:phage replication O-like protein O